MEGDSNSSDDLQGSQFSALISKLCSFVPDNKDQQMQQRHQSRKEDHETMNSEQHGRNLDLQPSTSGYRPQQSSQGRS